MLAVIALGYAAIKALLFKDERGISWQGGCPPCVPSEMSEHIVQGASGDRADGNRLTVGETEVKAGF